MKYAPLVLMVLAACANPVAAPNPNAVPNIQRAMEQLRQSGPFISVAGGVFDGAAAGQRAAFVATPDDTLICTFQTAPDPTRTGLTATVTGYRLNVSGIYAGLSGVLLPNVVQTTVATTELFAVQTATTRSSIDAADPRLANLMAFFAANPTPCWSFG